MSEDHRRYEEAENRSREEILELFNTGQEVKIISALHSATYYDSDWRWSQSQCLRFLNHHSVNVRWAAASFLGDIAALHHKLDLDLVLPALQEASKEAAIHSVIEDTLDFIHNYIKVH
jgi:hypothetical protein